LARVLIGALPLQFAFGLVYSWGAVAPFVQHDLGWPPLLVAAVFSASPIGYGTGIVIGGRLADRLPPRRLCWAGLLLLALGLGVALLAPSGPTFVFFYAMLGLGFGGGLGLAGSIAAARYGIPERAGTASGLVTGAYAIAGPVQVPVVSVLAGSIGWLPTLRGVAGTMLAIAALTLAVMPSIPRPRHLEIGGPHASPLALLRRPRLNTAILLEITGTPLGAYAFVNAAGYARGLALAAAVATGAIAAVAGGNVLGRIAGGALSDRIGVDRVMAAIFVLDLLAAATLFLHPGAAPVVGGALLAGIGFGAPAGVIGRLAEDAAPDAPNSAFGLIFAGFAAGTGAGSLLGAAVGGAAAWAVVGSLAVAGLAVLALRLRLRKVEVLAPDDEHSRQDQGQDGRAAVGHRPRAEEEPEQG
jgi:OFA family oxalate/formate antiporter-like MFS transporter